MHPKTQWVLGIVLTLTLSFSGWAAVNIAKIENIDTREKLNSASAEHAIERVSKENTDRMDKIDTNVQWLIKEFIEFRAEIRTRIKAGN